MPTLHETLSRYLPADAVEVIADWTIKHQVRIKITRSRSSKAGDYRAPEQHKGHRISINHDLNPYAFLITLVHEFAHLTTWKRHNHRVHPHGKEWKKEFQALMGPFFYGNIFPADVLAAIRRHMQDPAAAGCSDTALERTLRLYNKNESGGLPLESLPDGTVFRMENGRCFRKGKKLRKNFLCKSIHNGALYRIHPLVQVAVQTEA